MNETRYMNMERNTIYEGDVLAVLRKMPPKYFNIVVTSPPYWAVRDYGIPESIWDDPGDCNHEYSWETVDTLRKPTPGDIPGPNSAIASKRTNSENRPGKPSQFCALCGAWKGNLGLEPYPELFIKHLCDVFDEVRRVLRDDGIIYVNMGDTYGGSGGAGGDWSKGPAPMSPSGAKTPGRPWCPRASSASPPCSSWR